MLSKLKNHKKGFTLIEIVIVLAIAALILVIVFLAVGGAQRAQRDKASQESAAKVIAGFSNWLADNDGNVPTGVTKIPVSYLKDGNGVVYKSGNGTLLYTIDSAANVAGNASTFVYAVGKKCDNTTSPVTFVTGNANNVAVSYWSEQSAKAACKDNQ